MTDTLIQCSRNNSQPKFDFGQYSNDIAKHLSERITKVNLHLLPKPHQVIQFFDLVYPEHHEGSNNEPDPPVPDNQIVESKPQIEEDHH
jgi:hypothetical protein